MKTAITLVGMLLLLSGCAAHVLSEQALQAVDPALEYAQVRENPEAWRGSTLVLGGRVLDVRNDAAGSTIEILHYDLNRYGQPVSLDEGGGRFLAKSDRFLDPEVYEAGRFVTLTGTVEGTEVRPVNEVNYRYPVFRVGEIRLLRESPYYRGYGYAPYYYYYPYYYGDPFYDPWYDPWYPWRRYPFRYYRHPFYGF